jgi:uncharacterized protein (TIGR02646 family)
MKHIVKQTDEPKAFNDWKALANPDWQPTYDDLRGEPKEAVKDALMLEQGYICCYCERRLVENDSHIEHLRPQSDPTVDPLDYFNLLCSCQQQMKKSEPQHCGNLKDNWFDDTLLVSPLEPDCERRFAFTGDGGIKPADRTDKAAVTTIKKLGLDIRKLNDLRAKVLEAFLDENMPHDEFENLVADHLSKDSAGRFGEFWTMIRYQFGG